MRTWIWSLLIFSILVIPWSGQAETWQASFEKQIHTWAKELSIQDKRFIPFTQATIHYEALGPNSRQWMVNFMIDQQNAGYMIVGQEEHALVLLEYGLGEYPLFDESAIHLFHSDPKNRTAQYAGLESVWNSPEGIFDAKSGEKYPSDAQVPLYKVTSYVSEKDKLFQVIHKEQGIEEPWIKPAESIGSKQSLMDQLSTHEISYIARLFKRTVLAPFSVIGYHYWGGELFVELEDNGSRFIPYDHAIDLGSFHF